MPQEIFLYVGDLDTHTEEMLPELLLGKTLSTEILRIENISHRLYRVNQEELTMLEKLQTRYNLVFRPYKKEGRHGRIELYKPPKSPTVKIPVLWSPVKLTPEEKRRKKRKELQRKWKSELPEVTSGK